MLENSPADATQLPTGCQPESLSLDAMRTVALTVCACWERSIGWPSASLLSLVESPNAAHPRFQPHSRHQEASTRGPLGSIGHPDARLGRSLLLVGQCRDRGRRCAAAVDLAP